MEPTIKCGRRLAEHADLSGSRFHDVNLSGAEFDDVNMSKVRFHNINMSDITVTAVQIGGAHFKHIGPPPDKDGRQARQRPVLFEEMMLCDGTFRKVDLSNVQIKDCNTDGMTIDGIPVADMMAAYKKLTSDPRSPIPDP